jgi:hypothetical protein
MAETLTRFGGSPFKVRRSVLARNGLALDVDPTVDEHLQELDALLGKEIIRRDGTVGIPAAAPKAGADAGGTEKSATRLQLAEFLASPLTPKQLDLTAGRTGREPWKKDSLAARLNDATAGPGEVSLSTFILNTNELSELRFAFDELVQSEWSTLESNTRTILGDRYPNIRDFLVARGYYALGLHEEPNLADRLNALKIFVLHNSAGIASVVEYAAVTAARRIIRDKALNVPDYNVDNSTVVRTIRSKNLSLSSSFGPSLLTLVNDVVSYGDANSILKAAKIGDYVIPEAIKPQLAKLIKASAVPIDDKNVDYFLPIFLAELQGLTASSAQAMTAGGPVVSDGDFDIDLLQDDKSLIEVSSSAVKCAAQLFYSMVLGDELDVFNVVNFFTHKYIIRGGIEVLDGALRDDLQAYVFSDRFTDLKTKRVVDRTRPAERQMFYRQVFNYGKTRIPDDVIVNHEFPRLWKMLMLECANFLERAEASPHPDSFVSPQKIQQAVEDLQYNLSTHCTGMANVISPLIYAELNFAIRRILQHPEVVRQVTPVGGTWWRVVEKLYMEMKHERPKATVYYNKATLGNAILRSIADYDPSTFVDGTGFSTFIGNVDAFITTQSILQEALTDDLKRGEDDERDDTTPYVPVNESGNGNGNGHRPRVPATAGSRTGSGSSGDAEWDF